jgi:ATP-dependent protease ClpP protease subunit
MSSEIKNHKLDKTIKYPQDDPLFYLYNHDLDVKGSEIFLGGVDRGYEVAPDGAEPGVDYVMANRFIKNARTLMKNKPKDDLLVHMSSCGGDWNFGMAIYDSIRAYPNRVTILAYGHARSMTSIILQAANKRVLMPHCDFMFHLGSYGDYGTQKEVESNISFYKKSTTIMLDIYSSRMKERGKFQNKTIKYIKDWLKREMDKRENVWMTPKQAVELGLADEVFDYNWTNLFKYTESQSHR